MVRENLVGTSVRVPQKILDRLEAAANRSKWSKGEIHRQALEFYLSVLEGGHFLAPLLVSGVGPLPSFDLEAAEETVLATMKRLEPGAERGALVGFRELRPAAGLSGTAFDAAVLALAQHGRISLHRHDFPKSLNEEQREELFQTGEDWFVGCAISRHQKGVTS